MSKIIIDNPKDLGVKLKYSIEDVFKEFGKVLIAAASPNPIAWVGGLGHAIRALGSLRVEKTVEGKAYQWVYKSFTAAFSATLKKYSDLIDKPFNGDWFTDNHDRFESMFDECPLEIDLKFLETPLESAFVKALLDGVKDWSEKGLQLEGQKARKFREALKQRLFQELMAEVGSGVYKSVIEKVRHELADVEKHENVRQNYREYLKSMYFRKVLNEPEMMLADIYIEPDFYLHRYCIAKNDPRQKNRVTAGNSDKETFMVAPNYKGNVHELVGDFLEGKNTIQHMSDPCPRFMILLGHPGQGKSSFCIRLVNDLFESRYANEKEVFFTRLRDVKKVGELFRYPEESLRDQIKRGEEIRQKEVFEFRPGEFMDSIWVLDGLDELVMRKGISDSDVDHFLSNLADLSRQENGPQIVLTSRLGYINEVQWRNTLVIELASMKLEHQKAWLNKYKVFHPGERVILGEEELDRIAEGERPELEVVGELLQQPILLHMVITSGLELDAVTSKASLYRALFDKLIQKVVKRDWDNKGEQLKVLEKLSKPVMRKFLQEIALAIWLSDGESITAEELKSHESTNRLITSLKHEVLKDALKYVLIAFYFQSFEQENDGSKAFEFLHKSFQEYLVAEKIWRVFLGLTNKDEDGLYTVEGANDVLGKLFPVLSKKAISREIQGFLHEIIQLEGKDKLQEIFFRLKEVAPGLYRNQFLLSFDGEREENPLTKIVNVTYAFFFMVMEISSSVGELQGASFPAPPGMLMMMVTWHHPLRLFFSGKVISMEGWSFLGADFWAGNFYGVNLQDADLRRADFKDADLKGANLEVADCRGASFHRAGLRGAVLEGADFENADFRSATLRGAHLEGADLQGANFHGASLQGADLQEADLRRAKLWDADLQASDLRGVNLRYGDLRGANLQSANLQGADLQDADFRDADLRGADLRDADLEGADFRGADLRRANLTGIGFQDVNLEGAKI